MKKIFLKKEKGVSLLLVVLIIGIILAIALGISHFMARQVQMLRETGNAIKAFYIADSGIEKTLYLNTIPQNPISLFGGSYQILCECKNPTSGVCPTNCSGSIPDYQCNAPNFCLKATGNYSNFRQAIFLDY